MPRRLRPSPPDLARRNTADWRGSGCRLWLLSHGAWLPQIRTRVRLAWDCTPGWLSLLWQLAPPPPACLARSVPAHSSRSCRARTSLHSPSSPAPPPPPAADERPTPPRTLSPAPSWVTGLLSQPARGPRRPKLCPAARRHRRPRHRLCWKNRRSHRFVSRKLYFARPSAASGSAARRRQGPGHISRKNRPSARVRYWCARVASPRLARSREHDLESCSRPSSTPSVAPRAGACAASAGASGAARPEQSQTGWLVRRDDMNRLQAEIRAAQDAYDEAAVGREAEVEVELDRIGAVVAVRLILPSGRASLIAKRCAPYSRRCVRPCMITGPGHRPLRAARRGRHQPARIGSPSSPMAARCTPSCSASAAPSK